MPITHRPRKDMIDLRELSHLVVLCEHQHFGRAAAALGLSQPALTKSIQRLERALGVRLVDRGKHGVVPTPLGQEVLRRAQPMIADAAELRREIELMRGVSRGPLAVGIGPAMSESRVVEAIARQVQRGTGVNIQVRVDHWTQLSEWLLERKLDLFVADITEAEHDARFTCRPLPREKIVWFCRAQHPLITQRRVTRRDLLKYPLATPRMPGWANDWFAVETARGEKSSPPDPFANLIECENYAMLKRMVLSSDCVSAALTSTIAPEVAAGTIVPLKVKAPPLTTQAGIVTLRGRTLSPLAEALIEDMMTLPADSAARTR